jgi:LCP family protein required for cell wall assembly
MSRGKIKVSSQTKQPSNPQVKITKSPKPTNWWLAGFGLSAIAIVSAAAGGLLALSLAQTPLRQAKLSLKEQAAFNQDKAISYSSLQLPKLSRPVNILILGIKVLTSDVNEKPQEDLGYHALVNSFDGLADTMVLLRFDPDQDKLTLLSIPRDTRTEIPGYGIRKINDANVFGGPALAAETVTNLLAGVEVDRYIRVNVQGIEKLIDALGGVNVYVPKDMKYSDDSQHLYINLKEGTQHLNGKEAVDFLRFRYDAYGDIGRVQRQQTLMRAVIEQALSPKTLVKLPDILAIIHSHLDTNLTTNELLALTAFAAQQERSDIKMLMLPGDFSLLKNRENVEISYWQPYPRSIKNMMQQHFALEDDFYNSYDYNYSYEDRDAESIAKKLRIAIQDSTDNPEAVAEIVKYLQEEGYTKVFVSRENLNQPLQKSKIIAQKGDDLSAAELRANLGFGEVLVESTGVLSSDITVQLGQDWLSQYRKKNQYQTTKFPDSSPEFRTTKLLQEDQKQVRNKEQKG